MSNKDQLDAIKLAITSGDVGSIGDIVQGIAQLKESVCRTRVG